MQSARHLLTKCTYCGKLEERQYLEAVSQIPNFKSPQNFILTTERGKDDKPLSPTDLLCVTHEDQFRLKYKSQIRGGKYTSQFKSSNIKRNEQNPAECVYCQKVCEKRSLRRKISCFKNHRFIKFIVDEGIQRVTRLSGTGISEDDDLCSKCYQILRKKWAELHYSPVKPVRSTQTSKKRKSKRLANPPPKQT